MSLGDFLLIRGVKFLEVSPIFLIRVSPTSNQQSSKGQSGRRDQQEGGQQEGEQKRSRGSRKGSSSCQSLQGSCMFIPCLARFPRISNVDDLQLAESHPSQSMKQIIVSCSGKSEAAPYLTLGIKTKAQVFRVNMILYTQMKKGKALSPTNSGQNQRR